MAKHDSDFTHTMAASTMFEGIIDQVRSSNLNYQIQMTPSSVKLKLEVEFDFGKLDAVMHKLKLLLSLSNWVSFALSFYGVELYFFGRVGGLGGSEVGYSEVKDN